MSIESLMEELAHAREEYQYNSGEAESVWRPLSDKVKELQAALHAAMAEGANPCASCGSPVMVVARVKSVSPTQQVGYFEAGCSASCGTRGLSAAVVEGTREDVIASWNSRNPAKVLH